MNGQEIVHKLEKPIDELRYTAAQEILAGDYGGEPHTHAPNDSFIYSDTVTEEIKRICEQIL